MIPSLRERDFVNVTVILRSFYTTICSLGLLLLTPVFRQGSDSL